MKTETKRWTHLGLGAALAGSTLLAACGQGSTPAPSETATPAPELETEAPEAAETSTPDMDDSAAMDVAPQESGEGEGGVAIEQAGTDPIVFTSALAITEAHIVAARDAFLAGETQAAAEMFAHPVSEVLFDVGPYLQERGVENFDDLLTNASIAVFDGADGDEITERTAEIIETLRAAEEKAPDNGMSDARVAAGVVADQIDRAAYMYTLIAETDEYEPYLDGYGFYKAAQAPELLAMPWEQAARQFVDRAMQGYSTAYSERPWFFELELGQTVCAGLWELLRSSRADPCRNSQAMERVVIARYESSMDTLILEKAMWDATMATFPDQAVGPKVYKALLRVRAAALEKAMPAGARDCKAGRGGKGRMLSDRMRQEALEKVENFLKEWMESAMSRAWQAVDHSDSLITEVSVLRLFQSLVAPFGEDHPFSCVPADLTEAIGRPPHDWPFLRKAVRAMFASWRRVAPGNPKRRKKGAAAASAASAASPAFAAFDGCGNGNNGELPPLGASALTARAAAAAVVKQEVKDESGGGADG